MKTKESTVKTSRPRGGSQGSATTLAPPEKNRPPIAVRRNKSGLERGLGWFIADSGYRYFAGSFLSGVLRSVIFVGEAPPMVCVQGYDSTGEAIGLHVPIHSDPEPPANFRRSVSVVYDRVARFFHAEGDKEELVAACDELHLYPDGRAVAYWL
jgi:hypothetical protein